MTNTAREDWAKELERIATKISDLANDIAEDKYSQAIKQIKEELEKCKNELDHAIKKLT